MNKATRNLIEQIKGITYTVRRLSWEVDDAVNMADDAQMPPHEVVDALKFIVKELKIDPTNSKLALETAEEALRKVGEL